LIKLHVGFIISIIKDQDIPLIQHQEGKEELRATSSSRKMIDLSNTDEQYIPDTRGLSQ
jgi:hypothetical protein